jgi:hypothetical protein
MAARSAILILNHHRDRHLIDLYAEVSHACGSRHDVFLLSDRTKPSISLRRQPAEVSEVRFTAQDLIGLGYPGKQDIVLAGQQQQNLKLGNAELPVLLFHADRPYYSHYWIVEYDVRFSGNWLDFFAAFESSSADLLGTSLIRYPEFTGWSHWRSLSVPSIDVSEAQRLRGLFPVYRISNEALACLAEHYRQGCSGHMETLMPTVLHACDLVVEDIGGDGEFVAPENTNRFYTNQRLTNDLSPGTFVYRPIRTAPGPDPNMLWHPVKPRPPFALRLINRALRVFS